MKLNIHIQRDNTGTIKKEMTSKSEHIKVMSLFANIGVAEAYFAENNIDVVLANELIPKRAKLYQAIYPETEMICGDITSEDVLSTIEKKGELYGVDVIMATPPCQGMSTAGQKIKFDERNSLVMPALKLINKLKPKFAVIENVPDFRITSIIYKGKETLLPDVVREELQQLYNVDVHIINTDDYSVPQTRERMIILISRKDQKEIWTLPKKDENKITMRDAIGSLKPIDPYVKDITPEEMKALFPYYEERKKEALLVSKWNQPPVHIYRQVMAMRYTPSGCTAFDNADEHKPTKADGSRVRGYHNTYKRQNWDTPAYTITMDNRKISSQNNVHPGRFLGVDENGEAIYSDPRALTLYEIMKIMSLPDNWAIPDDTEEAFLRRIIGEGIPPLFMLKLFKKIPK